MKPELLKPGWKTSELWVTLFVIGFPILGIMTDAEAAESVQLVRLAVAAVAAVAYNISRGLTKLGHASQQPAQAEALPIKLLYDAPALMRLAEAAYVAYGTQRNWLTYDNKLMPQWVEISPETKAAWSAAVAGVLGRVEGDLNEG